MIVETILAALLRINLVASVAILLVLLLRPLALRWLGAGIAYWLWLVVAVAAAASFLPPRERVVVVSPPEIVAATREPASPIAPPHAGSEETSDQIAATPSASVPALADALVALWLLGAVALLVRSTVSTRRLAADPSIGPALVGVLWPRLVLPADFETRFDAQERALILAHEEVHRVSGQTGVSGPPQRRRGCCHHRGPEPHVGVRRLGAATRAARHTDRHAAAESRLDAGFWRPQESAHRTRGQASRLVYRQSACRQHRSCLLRHDGHRDVVVAGQHLGWRGPRQAGVGSGLRIAQGREFRLAGHTFRELVVAHAERRTGRLRGEARRAARCRRQGHQRRPTDRQHWRPTDRRPPS